MPANLRVHIAPVGFEFKRVTEPLVRRQADKVYLVAYGQDDKAQRYMAMIKKELKENYSHIIVKEVYIDIWDLYECIQKFKDIIADEAGNHIYINVSTGTKITAIAGMLSCMLYKAEPYYAKVYFPDQPQTTIPSEQVDDPETLPVYDINKPDPTFVVVLDLLEKSGGKMRKSKIIEKLEEKGIIRQKDETKVDFTKTAKHSQLRAILDPMEYDWNYITVDAKGRRSEVSITEQGRNARKIFCFPTKDDQ